MTANAPEQLEWSGKNGAEERFFCMTAEPGESFESERVDGAIAYCPPPSSYIRYVEVVFEDGTKAIYIKGYQPPRDSDYYSRQDSTIDWNYEEEVTASHAVRTRWTYTFTNADYDAAVAQQFAE